jgi:hypothetical protein
LGGQLRWAGRLHRKAALGIRLGSISRERQLGRSAELKRGVLLGKFAFIAFVCAVLSVPLVSAQQIDVAVGASVLTSTSPPAGLLNFQPPAEKGGTYVGGSFDFVGYRHRRLGLNVETAWRIHPADYENYETYRPILTDVNVLFQPRIGKRVGADLFGGVGVASTRFNLPVSCNIPGCVNYTSSNHFMEDLGAGVRVYFWQRLPHVFIRPEIHYYHIQNNVEFHSDNVFRGGASIGYTFGSR